MIVVSSHLDFNMLLGCDCVYAMNVLVFMLFRVIHFPHNESIVIIDQLAYDNHHPNSTLAQVSPLYVPSFQVESSPSRDKVLIIDRVLYSMGGCDPFISPFGQINIVFPLEYDITICNTSSPGIFVSTSLNFLDVELPLDEAILEAMIMDFQPLPKLENLRVGYRRNPWPEPSHGLYLDKYYA
jgi:hypothetical protein